MVDAALRGASVRPSGTREDMLWLSGRGKANSSELLSVFLSSRSCDSADNEVGKRQRETPSEVGSSLPRLCCSIARSCTGTDSNTCLDAADALYSNSDSVSASTDLGSLPDENDPTDNDRQPFGLRSDKRSANLGRSMLSMRSSDGSRAGGEIAGHSPPRS